MVSIHLRGCESLLVFCFRGLSRLVYHLYVVWLFASSLMNFWFTYQKKKTFIVGVVSQYMHVLCGKHLEEVNRMLRHTKMTTGKGLFFGMRVEKKIEAFIDADWAGLEEDNRFTSEYCTFV